MVGVVGSSPIAPTKFGRRIKHLAETLGAFFIPYGIDTETACQQMVLIHTLVAFFAAHANLRSSVKRLP